LEQGLDSLGNVEHTRHALTVPKGVDVSDRTGLVEEELPGELRAGDYVRFSLEGAQFQLQKGRPQFGRVLRVSACRTFAECEGGIARSVLRLRAAEAHKDHPRYYDPAKVPVSVSASAPSKSGAADFVSSS